MRRLRTVLAAHVPARLRRLPWPLWAALIMTAGGLLSGWPIAVAVIIGALTGVILATTPRSPR